MLINEVTLRKIREVYRLSCDEVGALLDVSGRYVNYIENGERRLTEQLVGKLITELELTDDKLARIISIYDTEQQARAKSPTYRSSLCYARKTTLNYAYIR
jgi:plasmid maintenance system antidote protein VapI